MRISAADAGAGVHTARLLVDGAPAGAPVVVDANGGRCAQRPDGSFDFLAPCPSQVGDAAVTLDAGSVPNGPHTLAVQIADAAGNVAVSAPAATTVANPPPPVPLSAIPPQNPLRGRGHLHNGSGGDATGTLSAGLRSKSGGKLHTTARIHPGGKVRVSGRLVGAGGKPVGGAALVVRTARPGRNPQFSIVRTRPSGTFTSILKWGKSKRVAVLWYPSGDSTSAVGSRTLRAYGAARISMQVRPRAPRNGQSLRFTGKVFEAPEGARVTIQVLTGRYWRTFLTPAVDARGRFAGKRLLMQSAGLSYCLRARSLSPRGFGYSAGFSKSVCRRVHGA